VNRDEKPLSLLGEKKDNAPAVDPQAVDFVLRADSFRRQCRCSVATTGITGTIAVVGLLLGATLFPHAQVNGWLLAAVVLIFVSEANWMATVGTAMEEIVAHAKQSRDKRKIGVLLDEYWRLYQAREHPYDPEKAPLITGLARILAELLPQIDEEDSVLILPAQRKVLRSLISDPATRLSLEALHALGKIGDYTDLLAIEKLLNKAQEQAKDMPLIQVAKRAVTQIEARLAEQKQIQSLLRASIPPNGTTDHLLHPVTPTPNQTDVEQLLRAEQRRSEFEKR